MSVLNRRRVLGAGDSYPVVEVIHPDAWEIKIKTTAANQRMRFAQINWSNVAATTKIILDNTVYEGSDINTLINNGGSGNTFYMYFPEPGDHTVYIYTNSNGPPYWYSDLTDSQPYYIRTARNCPNYGFPLYYYRAQIYIAHNDGVHAVVPPAHMQNYGYARMFIPYKAVPIYAATSWWANHMSYLTPVKYKFIED